MSLQTTAENRQWLCRRDVMWQTVTDSRNWPSVTKSNPQNCKNCSSVCAYDCAQLQNTIQHRTVLIILLSIGGEGVQLQMRSSMLVQLRNIATSTNTHGGVVMTVIVRVQTVYLIKTASSETASLPVPAIV